MLHKTRLIIVGMISFCSGLLIIAFLVSGWAAIGVFLVSFGITCNISTGIMDIEDGLQSKQASKGDE